MGTFCKLHRISATELWTFPSCSAVSFENFSALFHRNVGMTRSVYPETKDIVHMLKYNVTGLQRTRIP